MAWVIHGAALAVPCAIYWKIYGEFWTTDSFGSYAGGLAGVFLVFVIAYVVGTTVVMVFAGRRVIVPLVMHGLSFAAAGLYWWTLAREAWAADAEHAAVEAAQQRLVGCLHVGDIHVTPGSWMRATLTLHNGCADAVSLHKVSLSGSDPDGGGGAVVTPQPPSALAPGQTVQLALESAGTPSSPSSRVPDGLGWTWEVTVHVDADFDTPITEKSPFLVCYGPQDPYAKCGTLPPVAVAPSYRP